MSPSDKKTQVRARIRAIRHALPEQKLSNEALTQVFPDWSPQKILDKTGIESRSVAQKDEFASDLGVRAAKKLFEEGICSVSEIDYLLFCTQSPDYFLPTTACIVQERLGLPTTVAALDINQGCSGYIYGLSLAKGLIETQQAKRVLLITAETYTKWIHPNDKSVRTLFGDGAAATLIEAVETTTEQLEPIGPFVFGTDGKGAKNLIIEASGAHGHMLSAEEAKIADLELTDEFGNTRSARHLYMNGPEIMSFTLSTVPKALTQLLTRSDLQMKDIDVFVFHQANEYMLGALRKKIGIPSEKFVIDLRETGNTVSSTIPIALENYLRNRTTSATQNLALVGFGVGYSWGATLVRI